jgi:hypothetical protein
MANRLSQQLFEGSGSKNTRPADGALSGRDSRAAAVPIGQTRTHAEERLPQLFELGEFTNTAHDFILCKDCQLVDANRSGYVQTGIPPLLNCDVVV